MNSTVQSSLLICYMDPDVADENENGLAVDSEMQNDQ